jgi:hypothetical protein
MITLGGRTAEQYRSPAHRAQVQDLRYDKAIPRVVARLDGRFKDAS